MSKRRENDDTWNGFDEQAWDAEFSEGSTPARPILLALVGLLVLAAVAVGAYILVRETLFDSPQHAAEEWVEVFIEGDTERLLDLTCNEQIWIANARAAAQTIPALLEVVPIVDMLDLIGILPGIELDLDALLNDIEFDLSNLSYSDPQDSVGRALMTVTGQLRFKLLGDAWFGIPVDERWIMVEEGGNWRWCGREQPASQTPPTP